MRQALLVLALLGLFASLSQAQTSVRTQDDFNRYSYRVAAGSDTVYGAKRVVGLLVGRWVASDTLFVSDGYAAPDTVARIIVDATPPEGPVWIPLGVIIDTLIYSQVKASDVTLIYRLGR